MKRDEPGPLASKASSDDVATSPLLDVKAPSRASSRASSASSTPSALSASLGPRIPEIGDVVGAKYRIEGVIGRGGMGIVLAARHVQLGERVAIKVLLLGSFPKGDFLSRFMREAQVTARLRNEHIARVVDVAALGDGTPYMVMEYVDGIELRAVMERDGKLPIALAVEYIVQACEGLAEAHANGIVHRDLKPPNFVVTARSDGSELLKILDFGISKLLSPEKATSDLTETGAVMGSPKYMSPEQFGTAADADTRSDVWALGAILYEMLAGAPAFNGSTLARVCALVTSGEPPPSLREIRPDVPPALADAVMATLELDREHRTPNVAALAGEVLAAIGAPDAEARTAKIQAALGRAYPDAIGSRPAFASTSERSGSDSRPRARQASRSSVSQSDAKKVDATPRAGRGLALGAVILALLGVIVVREVVRRPSRAPVPATVADAPTSAPTTSAAPEASASTPSVAASDTPAPSAGLAADCSATDAGKRAPKPGARRATAPGLAAATATSTSTPAPAAAPSAPAPANPYEGRL